MVDLCWHLLRCVFSHLVFSYQPMQLNLCPLCTIHQTPSGLPLISTMTSAREKHYFSLFSFLRLAQYVSVGLSQAYLRCVKKIFLIFHFHTKWNVSLGECCFLVSFPLSNPSTIWKYYSLVGKNLRNEFLWARGFFTETWNCFSLLMKVSLQCTLVTQSSFPPYYKFCLSAS